MMAACLAMQGQITFFLHGSHSGGQRTRLQAEGIEILYPVCNQVLEYIGNILHCLFCSMDYMLCPHVEMLLTHVRTLIFLFIFPGISGFYL